MVRSALECKAYLRKEFVQRLFAVQIERAKHGEKRAILVGRYSAELQDLLVGFGLLLMSS